MTSLTISLGTERLCAWLHASGAVAGDGCEPSLPENLHAVDLGRRLRSLVGVEDARHLRLVG